MDNNIREICKHCGACACDDCRKDRNTCRHCGKRHNTVVEIRDEDGKWIS